MFAQKNLQAANDKNQAQFRISTNDHRAAVTSFLKGLLVDSTCLVKRSRALGVLLEFSQKQSCEVSYWGIPSLLMIYRTLCMHSTANGHTSLERQLIFSIKCIAKTVDKKVTFVSNARLFCYQ